MNDYHEVFEKDFDIWLEIMNNYFITNMMFIYRNWEGCRKNFWDMLQEIKERIN